MTRMQRGLAAALAVLALTASACATTQRFEAAGDVHALLIAIRANDRPAFDAHVDRDALERDLESRILEHTQGASHEGVRQLGALLARPVAQLAGDVLIRPSVFLAVAEYYGYRPETPIPGRFAIASALRRLPDGRVCAARRDGPCLITFADEDGSWRLVSFNGDLGLLRLPQ
jgi:hypothetical protein